MITTQSASELSPTVDDRLILPDKSSISLNRDNGIPIAGKKMNTSVIVFYHKDASNSHKIIVIKLYVIYNKMRLKQFIIIEISIAR